jgi:hypothetical protein
LQQQGHAAETEQDLKSGLKALQLENDAVGVLQRCHLAAQRSNTILDRRTL